ncbi:HAD family hydrolase [Pontibacter ruber]|uniref:phosphoglycolate phosphatase n=1 Tax=Pontibacter ruber TaxID=1343895 RepID=A0ABW5CSZ5_9BACT|nr:HAD family hydrolase [Pontibacter ruber]
MTDKTDSLIFDLDGTLWDATATVARAWQKARKQVNFEIQEVTQETIRSVAGMQHDLIYDKLFPDLSKEQQKELMKVSGKEEMEHIQKYGGELYEGLEDTLKYLHGKYKLCIVSNCQDGYIEAFLEYHNLHTYFSDHECSGRTGKPKGENLRAVVERNQLQAPYYVGDTPGDHEASIKAGVPFIYARYGFREVEQFDKSIDRINDLTRIF